MNKGRKFGKEILSHFRGISLFVGGHFLSAPCIQLLWIVTCYDVEQEHAIDAVRQASMGRAYDTEETQGVCSSGTTEVYPFL